jgi:hypothetical protein
MAYASPIARDIGTLIWPVLSAFVGASESDEMVSIIVVSVAKYLTAVGILMM